MQQFQVNVRHLESALSGKERDLVDLRGRLEDMTSDLEDTRGRLEEVEKQQQDSEKVVKQQQLSLASNSQKHKTEVLVM